ncbi:MAG: TonB-dependent receptor [Bacteroidales bacterium]
MKKIQSFLPFLGLLFCSIYLHAQTAMIEGSIRNKQGEPLEFVNVAVEGTSRGTATDQQGYFRLQVPSGNGINLKFSYLGYQSRTIQVEVIAGQSHWLDIILEASATDLPDVEVSERQILSADITRLDPRLTARLPGPSGGVEGLIKTLPGVSSTSELSAQYSVRGGNFDENLVYVNGIEIYRPFLVRSGQQEGLSFLNSDLVESISFSAGGFEARYGDKMSSVLDITYKTPASFAGSLSMSLLEASLHLEGRSANDRLGVLVGLRRKSNQYLLGTLETQGDYQPAFTDLQALITYDLTADMELNFLGNYSHNRYLFEPREQNTRFGTVTDVKQLTVYFDGQELDRFITAMGAFSLKYQPEENLALRFTSSLFNMDESENFDIMGQYWLHRVETDMGRDDFGQPTGTPLGVGTFLNHARNYLNAIVWNASHSGQWSPGNQSLRWGITFQHEDIIDRLSEWSLVDSAGYSLPQAPDHQILLQDTLSARIAIKSNRISGYTQNSWEFYPAHGRFLVTAGIRANYWDYNRQFILSPRSTLQYKPLWASKWVLRASAGFYHQPPFYRELRDLNGRLNEDIKAQESIHFVLGSEYNFTAWNRPFKYSTEVYYKDMKNLIPYELDNVRIRYYADNLASGYATGIDMKVNGEFVPGVESWLSLSVMKTQEKIKGQQAFIPRPTDQRFNFSMFFQDFLPRNPSYKVQLGFIFGTGMPFGPPTFDRQGDTLRMPSYRRVDIGFSKQLISSETTLRENSPWRHLKSLWISAEVFNLLEINNTISYLWIQDVENRMFAVPNRLTSRLINVKLVAQF